MGSTKPIESVHWFTITLDSIVQEGFRVVVGRDADFYSDGIDRVRRIRYTVRVGGSFRVGEERSQIKGTHTLRLFITTEREWSVLIGGEDA